MLPENILLLLFNPENALSVSLAEKVRSQIQHCNHPITILTEEQFSRVYSLSCVIVIGDGLILLKTFSFFCQMDSPPIISIANDCEPILYNYSKQNIDVLMELFIPEIIKQRIFVQRCMKLQITLTSTSTAGQATCQIQIHRGMNQGILKLNIYLINHCTNSPIELGQMSGDGILISTPMGSLCKSMALNGPLMHKEMENILIIPICPLSLKFRPLCLPASTELIFEVDLQSRASGYVYLDSIEFCCLKPGEKLTIKKSQFTSNMAANVLESYDETFINGLRNILKWGDTYEHGIKRKISNKQM